MGKSEKELSILADELANYYESTPPYNSYVLGIGTSTIKVIKKLRKIDLRDNESLEDLCLSVYLRMKVPKTIQLSEEYKGVRVFYEVIGKIEPAKY